VRRLAAVFPSCATTLPQSPSRAPHRHNRARGTLVPKPNPVKRFGGFGDSDLATAIWRFGAFRFGAFLVVRNVFTSAPSLGVDCPLVAGGPPPKPAADSSGCQSQSPRPHLRKADLQKPDSLIQFSRRDTMSALGVCEQCGRPIRGQVRPISGL
jgi:hypothetical protein